MFLKIFIYYYIGPKTTFSETVNPVLPVSAMFKTNSCRCGPLCLVSVHHNASSILHRYSLLLKEKQLTVGVCSRCATVRSGANASAKADHQCLRLGPISADVDLAAQAQMPQRVGNGRTLVDPDFDR